MIPSRPSGSFIRLEAGRKYDTAHRGLCTVMIQHTSASLIIQENADPTARRNLEGWMREKPCKPATAPGGEFALI
jgi:hypothetical protein